MHSHIKWYYLNYQETCPYRHENQVLHSFCSNHSQNIVWGYFIWICFFPAFFLAFLHRLHWYFEFFIFFSAVSFIFCLFFFSRRKPEKLQVLMETLVWANFYFIFLSSAPYIVSALFVFSLMPKKYKMFECINYKVETECFSHSAISKACVSK